MTVAEASIESKSRCCSDLASLDGGIEALATARERGGPRSFLRASMALSRTIHEASHNRTLIRLLSTLEPQAMRYRFVACARAESLMDASIGGMPPLRSPSAPATAEPPAQRPRA